MGGGLTPLKLAEIISVVMEGNEIPGSNATSVYMEI